MDLLLGGVASGKSLYAEQQIQYYPAPWLYIGTYITSACNDAFMQEKIHKHALRRNSYWTTHECTGNLIDVPYSAFSATLLDCISTWISGRMEHDSDKRIYALIEDFIQKTSNIENFLVVTLDISTSILPPTASGRRFQHLLGGINQRLAHSANIVTHITAGIPFILKNGTAL